MNPLVSSGAKSVSGGLFGKLLRIRWGYFIIILLFVQAISLGISNGGGFEIVKSLGERFFNITSNLQETSLYIIDKNAVFDGFWDFIKVVWSLFTNAYLIFMWFKLFDWLWGKSPWSNESEGFKNFSFGIFIFFTFQISYLLLFANEGKTNL